MSYIVKWHPKAFKVLGKLPKDMIQRVLNKVDIVKDDPFRFLEHFEAKNTYKLRIGDYRALMDVDIETKLLLVRVFDHRKRIYKK